MARKPSFVVLGDIHLDTVIWKRVPAVTGDAFLAYKSFLSTAIKLNIPAVIAGDLFDTIKPDTAIVQFHREQMDRCRELGVPVYFIQGNHDRQPTPWASAVHGHAQWIGDGNVVDINGLKVVGLDYDLHDFIQTKTIDVLNRKDAFDVLIIHQAVKQSLPFEGKYNYDLDWLSVRADSPRLVVMADIHKPDKHKISHNRDAFYTGPSHARDIDQNGSKSCAVVYSDCTWERSPLPARIIDQMTVGGREQLEDVKTWVEKQSNLAHTLKPFLRVMHTPEMADDIAALMNDRVILMSEVVASVEDAKSLAMDGTIDEDEAIDPTALIKRALKDTEDQAVIDMATQMYHSPSDITDIIAAERTKVTA
jgi:DNA repair exonuclease SbcCD nuclease subunit